MIYFCPWVLPVNGSVPVFVIFKLWFFIIAQSWPVRRLKLLSFIISHSCPVNLRWPMRHLRRWVMRNFIPLGNHWRLIVRYRRRRPVQDLWQNSRIWVIDNVHWLIPPLNSALVSYLHRIWLKIKHRILAIQFLLLQILNIFFMLGLVMPIVLLETIKIFVIQGILHGW